MVIKSYKKVCPFVILLFSWNFVWNVFHTWNVLLIHTVFFFFLLNPVMVYSLTRRDGYFETLFWIWYIKPFRNNLTLSNGWEKGFTLWNELKITCQFYCQVFYTSLFITKILEQLFNSIWRLQLLRIVLPNSLQRFSWSMWCW